MMRYGSCHDRIGADAFTPVVRVDGRGNGYITFIEGHGERFNLQHALGFIIRIVWRTKQQRGMPQNALEQQAGRPQFYTLPVFRSKFQIRMRKSMVPDLMSFPVNSFQKRNVVFDIQPCNKKGCRNFLIPEDIQYGRGVIFVGAVIESDGYFFRRRATVSVYQI